MTIASRCNSDAAGTCAKSDPSGDAELAINAQTDPTAFGQLYNRHYTRILNYAFRCTLDGTVAEEVTSATFFHALRGLGRFDLRGSFQSWIYRIATNEIRMHWRRTRSARQQSARWQHDLARIFFDRQQADERAVEDKMRDFACLHQAIASLSEKYRVPITLRYFEELSYDQISEVMKVPASTARSLVHRGLKQLRRRLGGGNATSSRDEHQE